MATSVQSPSQDSPILSLGERQGTPSMDWPWLPLLGQWTGGEMDSPGPTEFIAILAGGRGGTVPSFSVASLLRASVCGEE